MLIVSDLSFHAPRPEVAHAEVKQLLQIPGMNNTEVAHCCRKPVLPETHDLPAEAYTVSHDLENTSRPQGEAFDVGAYE